MKKIRVIYSVPGIQNDKLHWITAYAGMTKRILRLLFLTMALPLLHSQTVVCSFAILQDLCLQLCQGTNIEVLTLVPNSVDPHLYQPKPSDSKTLAKADLVVINGLNLEGWLQNLIEASGYKGNTVVASTNVKARYLGKLPDPHIWHSPSLVVQMIDNLSAGLQVAFPSHAEILNTNAKNLKSTFVKLQTEISALFLEIELPKRIMLTTHDAFSYFAKCYELTVLSPQGVSTSDDPSAKDMQKIIEQIRKLKISAIFLENLANPKILNAIANETGKKVSGVLYADTLKDNLSLQATLWYNAVIIARAMQGALKNA